MSSSVDPFLVFVIVVITLVLLVVNLYVLVFFQHPDDKNTAFFPKVLVVVGLALSQACILLLPLDVGNKGGAVGCTNGWTSAAFCGGLDMALLWHVVSMAIAVFVTILVPFAIFHYEADDGFGNRAERSWWVAVKQELLMLLIVGLVLGIAFKYSAETAIPVQEFVIQGFVPLDGSDASTQWNAGAVAQVGVSSTVNMQVTFATYVMAMMGFVGWFLFVTFGGIGMGALPMDLIRGFVYRPRKIPDKIYADEKAHLQLTCTELMKIGDALQAEKQAFEEESHSRRERKQQQKMDRVTLNKYKQMVYMLETKHKELRDLHDGSAKRNPLLPYVKLCVGVVCALLTLLWDLQIILFMMVDPPADGFLNKYFIWFEDTLKFPLFGSMSVGIFSMYLLAAVAKGCFKFGLRCFCFAIHPMEVGATMMNSFLFNLVLILLSTIPTVQFSVQAFSDYARLTEVHNIFGAQIRYLKFFTWFYSTSFFVYTLFAMHVAAVLYLAKAPQDEACSTKDFKDLMQRYDGGKRRRGADELGDELSALQTGRGARSVL